MFSVPQNSFTSLFFAAKPQGKIGTLSIDCTLSDNHSYDSTITSNPVESGDTVSDHIYNMPFRLSMSGMITDTPFSNNIINVLPAANEHTQAASKKARQYLLGLRDARKEFTVVTGLSVYTGMFFTNITFNRDENTGFSINFNAELQQIKKVSSKGKGVTQSQIRNKYNAKTQGTTTVNQGSQRTSQLDAVTQAKLAGIFASGGISAGGA